MDELPFSGNNNDNRDIQMNDYDRQRRIHRAMTDSSDYMVMKATTLQSELCCPICLDLLTNTMTTKECLHRFCSECITTALLKGNKECPSCRKKLVSKRSLRPDPNIDAIIEKIWPDRKLYEVMQSKLEQFTVANNVTSLMSSIGEGIKAQAVNRRQRVTGSYDGGQQPHIRRRKRNANGELVEVDDDDNRSTPPDSEEAVSPPMDDGIATITDSHNNDDAFPPIEQLCMPPRIAPHLLTGQPSTADMSMYGSVPASSASLVSPETSKQSSFPSTSGYDQFAPYPNGQLPWDSGTSITNGQCNGTGNGNGIMNGNGSGPGSQCSNTSSDEQEDDIEQTLEDWEQLAKEENLDDIPDSRVMKEDGTESCSEDSESSSDDSTESSDTSSEEDGFTVSDVSDDTIPAQNGEFKMDGNEVMESETSKNEDENATLPTDMVPFQERLQQWFQNRPASVESVDMENPLSRMSDEDKPRKEEDSISQESGKELTEIELKLVPTMSFLNRHELWNRPPFFLSVPQNTTVEHLSKLLNNLITPLIKPRSTPLDIPYFWVHDRFEGAPRAQFLYMHEEISEVVKAVGSADRSMTLAFDDKLPNDMQSRLDNFVSMDYIDDLPNIAAQSDTSRTLKIESSSFG